MLFQMLLMMAVLNFVGHKTIIDILRKMEVNAFRLMPGWFCYNYFIFLIR